MTHATRFRQLNPHACRSYLVGSEGSPEVAILDPVLEHVEDYLELLEREKLVLAQAIDTHTHADHISGGAALKDRTGCDYVMHARAPARCVTRRVEDGAKLEVGGVQARVMHTPGHTADGVCLVFPDLILTGDTLFLDDGGAGRDDLPGGDAGEHFDSLRRILSLPGHLVVHPAHEYRNRTPSSLEAQQRTNPHLKPRSREEFERYLEELKLGPAEWMKDVLKANYACARDPKAAWIPVDVPACEVKGTLAHGANDIEVEGIEPEALRRLLDEGRPPVLLDVREEEELRSDLGRLPGIRHIPIASLPGRLDELEPHRDDEIVTVCRSGGRAHTAAQILTQAGFGRVRVLAGGMKAWAVDPSGRNK